MNKVWVVIGTTGEYSDRCEWYVCGYTDKEKATEHADQATLWAVRNKDRLRETRYDESPLKSPYDEDIVCDYTGTDYYVAEVEMRIDVPNG